MITKKELKSTIRGLILGIGSWFIVVTTKDYIVQQFPTFGIKHAIAIGVIIIALALLID